MIVLNDDRQMLADALRTMLSRKCPPSAVRAAMSSADGFDRDLWTALCEQIGAGGISLPEAHGGQGGGPVEAMIVAEELGRVLAPSPALGSSGMAAALLNAANDGDAKDRLLPRIAAGAMIVSVCAADAQGRWLGADPAVSAVRSGAVTPQGEAASTPCWLLTGDSHFVLDAGVADVFLVVTAAEDGAGIFEVDARSPGVHCDDGSAMDPGRALHRVRFDGAEARRLRVQNAEGALTEALDRAMILLAGEQVGAAARCLELTVEYTTQRVQFGRPIGSFQALKHRMADLHVLVQSARAVAYAAAASTTHDGLHTDAALAHTYCSEVFESVAAECVQLHGGIAITWEHVMQLYFKRSHSSSGLFGRPRVHRTTLEHAAGTAVGDPPSPT